MTVRVCVSVSGTDIAELLGRVRTAERLTADLIEVRLDKMGSHQSLSGVAKSVERPLIATNRPLSENGSFDGSEEERLRILRQAIQEGFEYVDVEVNTSNLDGLLASLRDLGAKIILSHHDHFRTPETSNLAATLERLHKHGPEISKIVTTAQTPRDNLSILTFLQGNHRNDPLVSFAMGKAGVWSRLMAPFYGSTFTYACLEKGMETAPGQPSIAELRRIYETLGLE